MSQPEVSISFDRDDRVYAPGELISGSVRLTLPPNASAATASLSLLWHTQGRSEKQDLGIAHAQPLGEGAALRETTEHPFSVFLPLLPLSYEGNVLQIRWLARVRVRCPGRKDFVHDEPFTVRE